MGQGWAQVQDWPARLDLFRRFQKARAARDRRAEGFYRRAAQLPRGTPEAQRRAIELLNTFRMHAGLVPVMPHPRIAAAAQAHAGYLERHTHTQALSLEQAHGETRGRSGFTGETVGARIAHQGLYGGSTEAVTSELDPEGAVEILMNSFYHRSGLLRQEARYAGFGVTTQAVIDLYWEEGTGDEMRLAFYPGEGQQEVPPRFPGGETPDPLPGVEYPVGSPISVGGSGSAPEIRNVVVQGPEGKVPVRILTPSTAPKGELLGDFSYVVPLHGLLPESRYRVRLEVDLEEGAKVLNWSFRTGTQVPGEQFARIESLVRDKQELLPGAAVTYRAEVEASHPQELLLRWTVDGQDLQDGPEKTFRWTAEAGDHRIELLAYYRERPGALMKKEFSIFVPGAGKKQGSMPREFLLDPAPPWARGTPVHLRASPPPGMEEIRYRFLVDDQLIGEGRVGEAVWSADGTSTHSFRVEIFFTGGSMTRFLELKGK